MDWDELFRVVNDSDATEYAGKRMENTHRRMRVYMTTADGMICLRRKRGVREGATDGPGLFTRGYAEPMREFERELQAIDTGQRIILRYNEQTHDLSLGFFIDDVEHLSKSASPRGSTPKQIDRSLCAPRCGGDRSAVSQSMSSPPGPRPASTPGSGARAR